ncbi:MAG: right-handed parallel beta-helix repeat-containing protein [Thermoplasmata archaeon]|nr:MAG: right-handed parallel beta-helix repeat-containing protein [Thermoplasmata archaeon]
MRENRRILNHVNNIDSIINDKNDGYTIPMWGRNSYIGVLIIFSLSILFSFNISIFMLENAQGTIIYVNTTGSDGAFTSIQDAIDAAEDGDTVFVYLGTYYENLVVNKTISLFGEDMEFTIIDGGGSGDVVSITVHWVNFTGFKVTGSGWFPGDAGIKLIDVANCKISGNTALNNEDGIFLKNSTDNNITGNIITSNFGYGIYLNSSDYNMICDNTATTNRHGIYLDSSNDDIVFNNTIFWNTKSGISLASSIRNEVTRNKVFLNDQNGIYTQKSSLTIISNNNISNNGIGIYVYSSCNQNIINNLVQNNSVGIHVNDSCTNKMTSNYVSINTAYGFYLFDSSNNWVYHNNIVDNADQGFDNMNSNFWNDSYPSGGNFWSDYSGVDNNYGPNQNIPGSDGIGDTNYLVDADSIDYFPLTIPYPDLAAPRIRLIAPLNNSVVKAGTILDFDIYDDNLYYSNYSINGGPDIPFSISYDIPTGSWADDDYTIKINCIDFAQNVNSSWFFFAIDSTKPIITLNTPENNSIFPSGRILDLEITDSHLSQADYIINGGTSIPLTSPFDIPSVGLEDGDYFIEIYALDLAGNANSSMFFFKIDSTKPIVIPKSFNNNSVVINGTALVFDIIDPNLVSAEYFINEGPVNPFTPPYEISTDYWADGPYQIQIDTVDLVGFVNSSIFLIIIDSEKPVIQLDTPANNSYIPAGTTLDFSIIDDNLQHVNYSLNGGLNVPLSSPFDIITNGWSEGVNILQINAMDWAGNADSSWFFFTVDSTPVKIILNSPSNNSVLTEIPVLDFSAEDENLVHVYYSINGGNDILLTEPYDIISAGWDDGDYIVQFDTLDLAGNTNSPWFLIVIDTKSPKVILDTPKNNTILTHGEYFIFHFDEGNLMQVNYSVKGSRNITISEPFNISLIGWDDGDYVIRINSLDFAGNSDSSWFFFVIDSTKPMIVLNSPENNIVFPSGIFLNFSVVEPNLMHVDYSTNLTSNIVIADPFDISTEGWKDGDYVILVRAVDLVGNYNSSLFFFSIDSTKPEIILQKPENNTLIPGGTPLDFSILDSNLAQVTYSINGKSSITLIPPFIISTSGWPEDDYTILINATDEAGNSNSSWFFFTIDSTLPYLWYDSSINHSTVPVGTTIQLNVSDIHLKEVLYSLDGGEYSTLLPPYTLSTIGWKDGIHIVNLKVLDAANNEVNSWFEITVDAIFPYVVSTTLLDQPSDEGIDNTIIIIFNEPIVQTNIKDHVTFSPSQDFECQWDREGMILSIYFTTPESDKEITYEVTVDDQITDINGNRMLSSFQLLFKTEVPTQPSESSSPSSEPVFPYWIIILIVIVFLVLFWLFYQSDRWPLGEAQRKEPSVVEVKPMAHVSIPLEKGPVNVYQRLTCPNCQTRFRIKGSGKFLFAKCPGCGAKGRITKSMHGAYKAAKPRTKLKVSKDAKPSSPIKEFEGAKPSSLLKEHVKLMQRLRCPNCRELFEVEKGIRLSNIKCPNCGATGSGL